METLEPSPQENDQSHQKPKTSFPSDIIEQILARVPVRSILRFRSVSKPWLSLISAPSFTNLHSSRTHRTALFISAYDMSAGKRYFFSAAHDGGPLTLITTVDDLHPFSRTFSQSEHLNGLVCFTSADGTSCSSYALVVNPSTHKSFRIPALTSLTNSPDLEWCATYLFGFDECRNEHKVLNIRIGMRQTHRFIFTPTADVEVFIFSMSDYTWRKVIDVFPRDDDLKRSYIKCSVCVGSVIYFMFHRTCDVLTFDLRTEKFSTLDVPDDRIFRELYPRVIKVNGCVGLVGYDVINKKAIIWLLQDYESRVWVRETTTYPDALGGLKAPFSFDSVSTEEIVFASTRSSRDVITVYVYNMKTRCFRQVEITLTRPFLWFDAVVFDQINCYVESLVPLEGNGARTG